MISSYNRPSPILGLLIVGSFLILLEGLVELGISSGISIPGVYLVIPGVTIALGVLLLLLTWAYAANPSGVLGVVFLILGGLSFLLGAGFVVGGIFVVVAGALAVFAEWVSEEFASRGAGLKAAVSPTSLVSGQESVSVSSIPASVNSAGAEPPGRIVVYRPCPHCGELNRPEFTRCLKCGTTIP